MNRRHPHTFRFYRRRMIGFCRRLVLAAFVAVIGIIAATEQGTMEPGQAALLMLALAPVTWRAALIGGVFAQRKGAQRR